MPLGGSDPGRSHREWKTANWIACNANESANHAITNGAGTVYLQCSDGSEYEIVVTETKAPR